MYAGVQSIMVYSTAGHGRTTWPFHQSLMYSFRAESEPCLQIAGREFRGQRKSRRRASAAYLAMELVTVPLAEIIMPPTFHTVHINPMFLIMLVMCECSQLFTLFYIYIPKTPSTI